MKKILFSMLILATQALNMHAQTINRYIPDGWECKNVSLNYGIVIKSTSMEEIAVVPPYYYANYSGEKVRGSAVVTELEGYKPYNSGWMVKSVGPNMEEKTGDLSVNRVPSNIIPNLNAPTYAAFYNCTNMKKIVLPPTIKKIGTLAFENCALTELVCMAVTPPTLADQAFDKVTIGKIIVPKGTLQTYKSTAGWQNFNIVEGAETYSDHQMVECNGAWYEVVDGEASLVNSDAVTDPVMPETVTCLIKGEWKTIPVTSIREWSVGSNITLNDKITNIPKNYSDQGRSIAFYVKDTHPTLKQLTKQVISNKKGNVVYYVFGRATVPHGVTSIANNALSYCTEAYLPTTLVSLGVQTTSANLYFTSPQPPTSSTSYGGYAPQEYLDTYNAAGYGRFYKSFIPVGYECIHDANYDVYWNPQNKKSILKNYTVVADDIATDNAITLPAKFYLDETANGSIEEYDVTIDKENSEFTLQKNRVPEGVKTITKLMPIHNSIYQREYNIQEIYLPSTLESCKGLSEISGLTAINVNPNNKKFDNRDNCNALIETATNTLQMACSTTVIPSSVEHIGDSAFYRVQYTQNTLSIPASVKSIGKHAFQLFSKTEWASIQIKFAPSSPLTCIEDSTFASSSITKIILPENVEYIGNGAFYYCERLNEVVFGNKVREIGDYAFRECSLTSVQLPDALETIGVDAFDRMPTLESVTFGKSLKKIGAGAYESSNIAQLKLPDSLEEIGACAFSGNTSLESIDFGKSNIKVGYRAFERCPILASLNINNADIGSEAFAECTSLSSVTINDASIGSRAFAGCENINEVKILGKVSNVGQSAFSDCSAITRVITSDISNWSFISFDDEFANPLYYTHRLYDENNKEITSIDIPDDVPSIGSYAFYGCTDITYVKVPKSVKSIGKNAFKGCSSIKLVEINSDNVGEISSVFGSQVTKYVIGDNVKSISNSAFSGSAVESITLGKGIKSIGEEAFFKCSRLTSVEIPDGVTEIGGWAFCGCKNLSNIKFPESLYKMGKRVLYDTKWYNNQPDGEVYAGNVLYGYKGTMPNNYTLVVKDGTTGVASWGVVGYKQLTSIVLPESVKYINEESFPECTNFDIYSGISEPLTIDEYAFDASIYENHILFIPGGTKMAYEKTEGWNKFKNIIEQATEIVPIEGVQTISFNSGMFPKIVNSATDLRHMVVENTYINIDNTSNTVNPDGYYNADEKCIVINKTTSNEALATAAASELGSTDFTNNYTGMVVEVNGAGSIKIDVQTVGSNKLAVKIGNGEAKTFAQTTKGDVTVNYDVTANTYVYLYAVDAGNQQQTFSMESITDVSDSAVKVYSITVSPNTTAIESIASKSSSVSANKIYSIDGKELSYPQRGLNIIKYSDGTMKKIMVK